MDAQCDPGGSDKQGPEDHDPSQPGGAEEEDQQAQHGGPCCVAGGEGVRVGGAVYFSPFPLRTGSFNGHFQGEDENGGDQNPDNELEEDRFQVGGCQGVEDD